MTTKYENMEEGEVLMEMSTWQLRANRCEKIQLLQSYIVHKCPVLTDGYSGLRFWWAPPFEDRKCDGCHSLPPDDMMGLWKLHNWEWVQQGGAL